MLKALEEVIGYHFKNPDELKEALSPTAAPNRQEVLLSEIRDLLAKK